jgi:hypothetical protein
VQICYLGIQVRVLFAFLQYYKIYISKPLHFQAKYKKIIIISVRVSEGVAVLVKKIPPDKAQGMIRDESRMIK